MSLNFSASCAKCEKTVYNDCYLILTPQGDKFFFCSTKCIHDFCEYALSQTKAPKIKEVHTMIKLYLPKLVKSRTKKDK